MTEYQLKHKFKRKFLMEKVALKNKKLHAPFSSSAQESLNLKL
jgi:hypothetical protein